MALNRSHLTAGYTTGSAGKTPAGRPVIAWGRTPATCPGRRDNARRRRRASPAGADLQRQVELGERKIVLCRHQLDTVGEELLLGVEHVENGTRADGLFLLGALK